MLLSHHHASPRSSTHLRVRLAALLAVCACSTPTEGLVPDASTDEPPFDAGAPIPEPRDDTRRSADRYEDNEAGLVAASTVARWVESWSTHRPAGVGGDLVVLQTSSLHGFVASTPGVRVYEVPSELTLAQLRSDGVSASLWSPARGARVDVFLRRYRIRPNHDFVLFVTGGDSLDELGNVTTAWFALRYWGVDHGFLGVLDGGLEPLAAELRSGAPAVPPRDGSERVTTLPRPNFHLLADLDQVQRAARAGGQIVDTRVAVEFAGERISTSRRETSCSVGAPACTAAYAGRIRGARNLPLDAVLDPETTRFRPLAEIDAALAEAAVDPTVDSILYDADATTSPIAAFTFLALTGTPAKWYSASFVSWSALQSTHPDPSLHALPIESRWRTDLPELSDEPREWAPSTATVRPLILDPHAPSTDRVQSEDASYRANPGPLPPDEEGGNPCL